ncbi:MAG: hypothetical protein Greene101449_171 [Candidatus Peregrinibacteria bacterium Greene1014_49]|nr:MAG: hypothetical protein Greene101449_171 [Candidatus Peregrinibacteria bacterium Greene1014_49]
MRQEPGSRSMEKIQGVTTKEQPSAGVVPQLTEDVAGACTYIVQQPAAPSEERSERTDTLRWAAHTLLPLLEDACNGDDAAWEMVRQILRKRGMDMRSSEEESSSGDAIDSRSSARLRKIAEVLMVINTRLLAPHDLQLTYATHPQQGVIALPQRQEQMPMTTMGVYDVQSRGTVSFPDISVPITFVQLLSARGKAQSYYPHYDLYTRSVVMPTDLLHQHYLSLRNFRRNPQEPAFVGDARGRHARRVKSLYNNPDTEWLPDNVHATLLHEVRHAVTDLRFGLKNWPCSPLEKMERFLKPKSVLRTYIDSAEDEYEREVFATSLDELAAEMTAAVLSADPRTILSAWRTTIEIDDVTEEGADGYAFSSALFPSREVAHIGTLLLAQKTGMIRHVKTKVSTTTLGRLWQACTNTESLLEFQPKLLIEIMAKLEQMDPQYIRDALRSIYNEDHFLGGPIDEEPLQRMKGMVPAMAAV